MFNSIEEAREFFKNDTFATTNGMVIEELEESACLCSMKIRDDHRNAIGGIMGGVIYTLADFAMAVCSNNLHKPTVALDANVNFLYMSKGKQLFARATTEKSGKTTALFRVEVTDENGKKVALVMITGYKL